MLIDRLNNIKICDFGFVRSCTDTDLSKTFCGSKSYAAPEILKVRFGFYSKNNLAKVTREKYFLFESKNIGIFEMMYGVHS